MSYIYLLAVLLRKMQITCDNLTTENDQDL